MARSHLPLLGFRASISSSIRRNWSGTVPVRVRSSIVGSVRFVPSTRRQAISAPGIQSCGDLASISIAVVVGTSSTEIRRSASSCCSRVLSFCSIVSVETSDGKYSFSNRLMSRSAIVDPSTGLASNGRLPQRRFSIRRRSSSGVAIARRGPTRIQARPL